MDITRESGIAGLDMLPTIDDLKKSREIYNTLPDDSRQPEPLKNHICNLAALFVRTGAHISFGVHLAHAHFTSPENTIVLGDNNESPYCRWAQATEMHKIELSNVHGHVFILTDHGFHPYEYQTGPLPDLSGVKESFLTDFADYLTKNELKGLLGLQVIDNNSPASLELVLPKGTVMLDESYLVGCAPTRQTGWKFRSVDGKAHVCQANETHGRTETTHEVFNKGKPAPILDSFPKLLCNLREVGVLRV